MNKKELRQLYIISMVAASFSQICAATGELPIEELPDEMREKCESLRKHVYEVGDYFSQKLNQIFDKVGE